MLQTQIDLFHPPTGTLESCKSLQIEKKKKENTNSWSVLVSVNAQLYNSSPPSRMVTWSCWHRGCGPSKMGPIFSSNLKGRTDKQGKLSAGPPATARQPASADVHDWEKNECVWTSRPLCVESFRRRGTLRWFYHFWAGPYSYYWGHRCHVSCVRHIVSEDCGDFKGNSTQLYS